MGSTVGRSLPLGSALENTRENERGAGDCSPLRIVRVSPKVIRDMYGPGASFPAVVHAGFLGDRFMGAGGLAWVEGRCWLWLDHVDVTTGTHAAHVVRAAQRMLRVARQMGEVAVFTPIDRRHPKAEKLLRLIGMEFHAIEGPDEIWRGDLVRP